MQQADIFILPSLHEGMPCVIVEALSCGMPILASRVGGIPEIVKENCGVLVQPNSINDLKEKILYMLENYNNFDNNEISEYAHKLFNYKVFSSKMIKEYKDIIANYQA
jgi:glycosyltransferase involved in cell wall biosynthesis